MLLVDAYNVLHVQGVLPAHLAGLDVDGLASLLVLSRYARRRVVLVCDGLGPPRPAICSSARRAERVAQAAGSANTHAGGEISIAYAGPDSDADTFIDDFLRRDSAARRWTVVSDDHQVRRSAGRAGASTLGSELFLRHLVHDERRPAAAPNPRDRERIPLGRTDVQQWLREFGVDVHAADHASGPVLTDPGHGTPPRAVREPRHDQPRKATVGRTGAPRPEQPATPPRAPAKLQPGLRPEEIDPVLRELLGGVEGITLDDLDMRRWLSDPPADRPMI